MHGFLMEKTMAKTTAQGEIAIANGFQSAFQGKEFAQVTPPGRSTSRIFVDASFLTEAQHRVIVR